MAARRWIAVVISAGVLAWPAPAAPSRRASSVIASANAGPQIDHVYRLVGRVRFLFFWVGGDDIGSARIAWRGDDRDGAISLLIGSDPLRAPRAINEWGYIREQAAGESTTVFGIRTVTDGDSPDEADARRLRADGLAEFGVLCSTLTRTRAQSRTTTIFAPNDATFRDTYRVLDVLERQARWRQRGTSRPAGSAPGFLTAMDRLMRSNAVAPWTFFYKDAIYVLRPGRVEHVKLLRTASRSFPDVVRAEIRLTSETDRPVSSFSSAYGTRGPLAGVPVWARFQPNWWFKIELELDDDGQAPPDPANDQSVRDRIASLCAASTSALTDITP